MMNGFIPNNKYSDVNFKTSGSFSHSLAKKSNKHVLHVHPVARVSQKTAVSSDIIMLDRNRFGIPAHHITGIPNLNPDSYQIINIRCEF